MRFEPQTDEQIAANTPAFAVWPAGEYDFEVKDAGEERSGAGNDMIKLTVNIFNARGERSLVFDYLVHTVKAAYKVKHFAEATGMGDKYANGEMEANDCVFKTGRCKVIIKKGEKKNDGTDDSYPDRNAIADYIKAEGARSAAAPASRARQPAPAGADLDDEIPF